MVERDVIVIGGGPAGLAAAIEAAKRNADVLLLDENIRAGGQLFKQIHKFFGSKAHLSGTRGIDIGKMLLKEAEHYGVEIWLNSFAYGLFKDKIVAVKRGASLQQQKSEIIKAKKIVIATGASENAVCFKGWTLPGVMGAGAAQTMINVNRVLPGNKILMIGSGNVGLIVSYQLMQAGADVLGIVEALPKISGYGVHAAKVRRAGVPIFTKHTVLAAKGKDAVEEVIISEIDDNWKPVPGTKKQLNVDTVAIAAGLKPMVELARMHGCEIFYSPKLGGRVLMHNQNMETTAPGIYVAGDATGIEEANSALEEGRIAGIAISESLGYLSSEEAQKLKEEVWTRLNGLRLGPFGVQRMMAKKEIIQKYNQINSAR